MGREDQGRQEHGSIGNDATSCGTQTDTSTGAGLFGAAGLRQRIQAVIFGAVAALPANLRGHGSAHPDAATHSRLIDLMTSWVRGAKLERAEFCERFFGRAADDPAAAKLRNAAMGASMATSHSELRDAASDLAAAQQIVGLDRWWSSLADAHHRAGDPATVTAVENSQAPSDVAKDAIRPVHPVETAISVAAADARATGRAIMSRQRTSARKTIDGRPVKMLSASGGTADPADGAGGLTRAGCALQKHGARSQSAFTPASGDPTKINQQGQDALDGLLSHPASTVRSGNRFGGLDVIGPDGHGARFDADAVFRGFLEPRI